MATKYSRLFAMSKAKIWTGASKPDDQYPSPRNQKLYVNTFDSDISTNKDIFELDEVEQNSSVPNPSNTNVTEGYEGWGLLVQQAFYSNPDLRN